MKMNISDLICCIATIVISVMIIAEKIKELKSIKTRPALVMMEERQRAELHSYKLNITGDNFTDGVLLGMGLADTLVSTNCNDSHVIDVLLEYLQAKSERNVKKATSVMLSRMNDNSVDITDTPVIIPDPPTIN
jgi:hypothetical protein